MIKMINKEIPNDVFSDLIEDFKELNTSFDKMIMDAKSTNESLREFLTDFKEDFKNE